MRYAVRPGDSLSKIAAAHGTTLEQLLAVNPQFRANPNRIRVGDVVEIPDTAAPAAPPPASTGGGELGDLSKKYETGGRGPGTVSSGVGDAGGVSYGSYQMTSKNGGTVGRFVSMPDFPWRDQFAGLKPGTPEFTAKWKAIASAEPAAFHAAQHRYIKQTHFDVLVANVLSQDGFTVVARSSALQDVVWSTAVQHGPNTPVVHRALDATRRQGMAPDAKDFDRPLITAIYAERGRRNPDGTLVYFSRNSIAVQQGVAQRFVDEERDAVHMLDRR